VVRRQKPAYYQEYCSDICRSIAQIFVGVVSMYPMSRLICMIFVADLFACRPNCFMSAVACRPETFEAVERALVWLL